MLTTIPIELWFIILEHLLLSHPFFSTNPAINNIEKQAAINSWQDRKLEADFVRQRRALRQVCHSWKEFVDRPEMKLSSTPVWHLHPPIEGAPSRKTLTFDEFKRARRIEGADMENYLSHLEYHGDEIDWEYEVIEPLLDAMNEDSVFSAEIITNVRLNFGQFIMESHPSSFPHLRALSYEFAFAPNLDAMSRHFPRMASLRLRINGGPGSLFSSIICSPSLTTLILTSYREVQGVPFDKWSLPSLQHLKIDKLAGADQFRRLLASLPHLGRELRVLDITLPKLDDDDLANYDDGIMDHLWNDCPKLESLRIPLYTVLLHPPAKRHGLRYLSSPDPFYRGTCWLTVIGWLQIDFEDALISFCHVTPDLVAVCDQHDWTSVTFKSLRKNENAYDFATGHEQATCQRMVDTALKMQTLGMTVRLEDRNGKTWDQVFS